MSLNIGAEDPQRKFYTHEEMIQGTKESHERLREKYGGK